MESFFHSLPKVHTLGALSGAPAEIRGTLLVREASQQFLVPRGRPLG